MKLAFPSALGQLPFFRLHKFCSFAFSLEENRISDKSIYKYTSIIRITLQILLGKCVFLGLRLALFCKFKKDASIFIAKNGIFQCCKD